MSSPDHPVSPTGAALPFSYLKGDSRPLAKSPSMKKEEQRIPKMKDPEYFSFGLESTSPDHTTRHTEMPYSGGQSDPYHARKQNDNRYYHDNSAHGVERDKDYSAIRNNQNSPKRRDDDVYNNWSLSPTESSQRRGDELYRQQLIGDRGKYPSEEPSSSSYDGEYLSRAHTNAPYQGRSSYRVRPTTNDSHMNNARNNDYGKQKHTKKTSRKACCIAVLITAVVCLGAGFAVGWFVPKGDSESTTIAITNTTGARITPDTTSSAIRTTAAMQVTTTTKATQTTAAAATTTTTTTTTTAAAAATTTAGKQQLTTATPVETTTTKEPITSSSSL